MNERNLNEGQWEDRKSRCWTTLKNVLNPMYTYIHTHTHTHTYIVHMHIYIYIYIYYALTLNPGDPLRSLVESSISGALYTSYALP